MAIENKIFSLLSQHTQWRMKECINLIPSENVTSPEVRELLGSDLGHRYSLLLNTRIHNVFIKNAYGGTKFTDAIESEAEEITKSVFNAKFCTLKPLSGHIAGMIMLIALCEKDDKIMVIHEKHGGYDGYMPKYMPNFLKLNVDYLPFLEHEWNLDSDATENAIRANKPQLVILGASFILFPYNIKPIRKVCNEVGAILGYDASHVLGLIAGGQFQKPLQDGVDIITGSTHKTLFGPQGGLILSNNEEIFNRISDKLSWHTLDNVHQNRVAALGQTMYECKEFGSEYAKQVIRNAQTLAQSLLDVGFPVKYLDKGFTCSHQVLLDVNKIKTDFGKNSMDFSNLFENENIIVDAVGRLGTNEFTRRGGREEDMVKIAKFMQRIIINGEKNIQNEIKDFVSKFGLEYCY